MENITEKKWFVYMGDHHEGPFSSGEIQSKVNTGAVTQGHYVWAEGMSDWKVMTDVNELSLVDAPKAPPSAPANAAVITQAEAAPDLESPPASHLFSETTGSFDSLLSAAPEQVEDDVAPNIDVSSGFQSDASMQLASDEMPTEATPMPIEAAAMPDGVIPAQEFIQNQVTMQPLGQSRRSEPAFDQFEIERVSRQGHAQTSPAKGRGWNLDSHDARPPKKGAPKLMFFLLVVGLSVAGYMGYLTPLINHPKVQPLIQKARETIAPYLAKFGEKLPFLNDLMSPIPALKDVSVEDLVALRKTATSNLMQTGPKVSVALATTDLRKPIFYVTTNLPDGMQYEVYIEGVSETLLNHFDFVARKRIVIMNRMAQTQPFEFQPGTALPQGNYLVSVYEVPTSDVNILNILASRAEAARQPPPRALADGNGQRKKVVDFKYYFLGGPKDPTYDSRLREYHEKLQVQAKTEIEELAQYTTTMTQVLSETTESFNRVKNSGNKVKVEAHLKALKAKLAMLSQFEKEFQSWTPESIGVLKFHSGFYMSTKAAYEASQQVLQLQAGYFDKKVEKSSFDIQMGEAVSRATDLLTSTRAKIKKASELGMSPMGMPQKVE